MADYLWLFILSIIGFSIVAYIFYKKHNNQKLVCFIGEGDECNRVVQSKYSTFFGIDLTIYGMFYYMFILAMAGLEFFVPGFNIIPPVFWLKVLASTGSAIASLGLTYIQFFILHSKCEWCISAALVNILIFLVIIL